MKVLLINGSPNKAGSTFTLLTEVAAILNENGIETELFHIGNQPVAGCIACGKCKALGKCVFDDDVNTLSARADEFDGMVIGAPVHYAAAAGSLAAFLGRLFYSNKGRWKGKVGAAVVALRRAGATATLDQLHKYFSINQMPIATSRYWNMAHGMNGEMVKADEEGILIMRTLGANMAWLMKSIEAGKKAGIVFPEK